MHLTKNLACTADNARSHQPHVQIMLELLVLNSRWCLSSLYSTHYSPTSNVASIRNESTSLLLITTMVAPTYWFHLHWINNTAADALWMATSTAVPWSWWQRTLGEAWTTSQRQPAARAQWSHPLSNIQALRLCWPDTTLLVHLAFMLWRWSFDAPVADAVACHFSD